MTEQITGINCRFLRAAENSRRIVKYGCYGDCLEGIGIVMPNKGIAVIDRNAMPQVGDVVHCTRNLGTITSYLKRVERIDGDITVGTCYIEKSRDFSFAACEIFGVLLQVLDRETGAVIWEKPISFLSNLKRRTLRTFPRV